jgi:serine/threonine protein kinase/tetratricopeptide (TPR) repeat protein
MSPDDRLDACSREPNLSDIVDELADRLAAGDEIDMAQYISRLPDHATQLQDAYESLRQMLQVRRHLASVLESPDPDGEPLGDFRILHEIGRGGMGIVYAAEQLSLVRRVAVKILPFAALLNARQLARFHNEARTAAMLRHSNIVNVHSVGCERGLHYYAMDLIDGVSLAEVIQQLRSESRRSAVPADRDAHVNADRDQEDDFRHHPSNWKVDTSPLARLTTQYSAAPQEYARAIAKMVVTLADALHYAHEQGVIHRDIKPSNLLLDIHGNPWITDFGLAQFQGDPGMTVTGDRLGTLRYMSPEQASGRKLLDHRTDVYSLGATLYELLTLRPGLVGDDREELVRRLEEDSFPLVRATSPSVPHDLETIVAKATANQPENRYESAADFASDLRRFLEQKPIAARRATRLLHLRRWVQRHRLTTALLVALFVMTTTLAVVGPMVAWNYRRLIVQERSAARAGDAVRQELESLLRDTLKTTLKTLEDVPNIDPLHQEMIQATLRRYDRLLGSAPDDLQLRFDVAKAYAHLGSSASFRFGNAKSRPMVCRAIELFEQLSGHDSLWPEVQEELGWAYFELGVSDWNSATFQRAASLFGQLVGRCPDELKYRAGLGWSRAFQGKSLIVTGALVKAERHLSLAEQTFRESLILDPVNVEHGANLSCVLAYLGAIHQQTGRLANAEMELREAAQLWILPDSASASRTRARISQSSLWIERSAMLYFLRQTPEAETLLQQSIVELNEIVGGFPEATWSRTQLMNAYTLLGHCYVLMGRDEDADRAYQSSMSLGRHPSIGTDHLVHNVPAYLHRGHLLWRTGKHDEAHDVWRRAIQLCDSAPSGIDVDSLLADVLCTVDDVSLRDPNRALEHARRALHPEDGRSFRRLGLAHFLTGDSRQAITTLFQGLERLNGGDAWDSFMLAKAYCHLKRPIEADYRYQRGCKQMDRPCLTWFHDLRTVKLETEELLRRE